MVRLGGFSAEDAFKGAVISTTLEEHSTKPNSSEGTHEDHPVEMKGITKHFPGVMANNNISFDLKEGEIHALLGENGSGKTTLMNILYGLYSPDQGEIWIKGKRVEIKSPKDALKLGIGMVHQHFTLVPTLTVTENIVLGVRLDSYPMLNLKGAAERILEFSINRGLRINPYAIVGQLSIGERQRVEIVKALFRGGKILILDEPTSVLTPPEVKDLFATLRSLAKDGLSIVFITHKLPEVMTISDRITVLRHGTVTARVKTGETTPAELSRSMVGREIIFRVDKVRTEIGEPIIEVESLSAKGDDGNLELRGVSLFIHAGEILGVAGVSGNGQKELAEALTGMRTPESGSIKFLGEDITRRNPRELIDRGIGHIPEDRQGTGLLMDFTVAENLVLEAYKNRRFTNKWILPFDRRWFQDKKEIRKYVEELIREYEIGTTSPDSPVRNLSGGNQQRLILARVISRSPKLLIAEQPTRGLDVGATEFIRNKLIEQKKLGVAILLISGDLNEVLSLSERIVVLYEGRIVGEFPSEKANLEEIGLMMTGSKVNKEEKE